MTPFFGDPRPDRDGGAGDSTGASNNRASKRLSLGGVGLLFLAVVTLACLFVASVVSVVLNAGTYRWADSTEVPTDGQSHTIRLGHSDTAMVWIYAADVSAECRFLDPGSGAVLPTKPVHGHYSRPGGSAGDYLAKATVQSRSGTLVVQCPRTAGTLPIHVESAPWLYPSIPPSLAQSLAQFGSLGLIPLSLIAGGVLLLLLAVAAVVRRIPAARPARRSS